VAGVQLKLDGANLGPEVTAEPYAVAWNSASATVGTHTLTAVARDAAGNQGTASAVTVTVLDTTPPTVAITSPAIGAGVSGTVTVAAMASDNTGVVGVQLKLDGTNLGAELTAAPYAVAWNTAAVADGTHTLTAVARDTAGNLTTAAAVAVTVSNNVGPAISAIAASSIKDAGATIGWMTSSLSDSQVEYGLTAAYGASTALNPNLVTSHAQMLSGLASTAVYHYRVKSKDAAGNTAVSGDFTFSTASDPNTGVVGYWKLDDGAGMTAADSSGNGLTATLVNSPLWTVGQIGGALALDGSTQSVNIPHAPMLDAYPLTVAVWMKTNATTGLRGIVNKYSAASFSGYQLFMKSGRLCAWYFRDASNYVFDGSNCTLSTSGYADDLWHQVTFVVDASGGRLYVDGNLRATQVWTGTPGPTVTTQPLNFGVYPGAAGGPYFAGALDDVRIYNRALSAQEVLALAGPANTLTVLTLSTMGAGLPDLVTTAISGPATGFVGQTVSVASTVGNVGGAPAAAFRITFYMSPTDPNPGAGTAVGYRDVSSLAVGTSLTTSADVTIPGGFSAGTYYLSAVADSGNVVAELDETNNGRTATSVIRAALYRPDLVISALTPPTTGALGRTIRVSNTVRNQGSAPAGAFRITFYMSPTDPTPGAGTKVGYRDLTGLGAGATSSANTAVTIPTTFTPGPYYLSAVADSGGAVTELDETNNVRTASTAVTVTP